MFSVLFYKSSQLVLLSCLVLMLPPETLGLWHKAAMLGSKKAKQHG